MRDSRRMTPLEGPAGDNFRVLDRRVESLESGVTTPSRLVTTSLVTGNNPVRHGLGRARGCIVVRRSAAVTTYDVDSPDPSVWIINSSGAASVTLLFL